MPSNYFPIFPIIARTLWKTGIRQRNLKIPGNPVSRRPGFSACIHEVFFTQPSHLSRLLLEKGLTACFDEYVWEYMGGWEAGQLRSTRMGAVIFLKFFRSVLRVPLRNFSIGKVRFGGYTMKNIHRLTIRPCQIWRLDFRLSSGTEIKTQAERGFRPEGSHGEGWTHCGASPHQWPGNCGS